MAKILIVDDRPINRQYLVSLLGPFGHQLLEAEDGADALLLADREHPDLVITDLHMPNADGPEFIRVLRHTPTGRATPVIVYTATQDTMTAREMVRDCGAFDVLVKPTEPAELLAVVNRALCAAAPLPAGRKPLPQRVPSAGTQLPPKVESATGEHRLAALVELILDLTEATDPEPLLKTFCHRCRSLIHAGSAAVIILDDSGEKVSHAVTSGFSADESATAKCDRLSLESPLISPVLRRHTLRLRNVKATDLAFPDPLGRSEIPSFLSVPIQTVGKVYGVLRLTDRIDAEEFSAEDERLSVTLASQLALSFENLHRLTQVQGYAARLEQEIRDREAAEAALELHRRERLRLKDEFLSHVSHELRSPLAAIHQFTTILLDGFGGELSPEQHEYLQVILRNSRQLAAMIGDMLTVTRADTGKLPIHPQPMDISALLDEALPSLRIRASAKTILLHSESSLGQHLLWADAERTRQVLTNLIENAIKFTPAGGTIAIRAGIFDDDSNFACVSVTDTGCGINPENLETVFERLFQESSSDEARKGLGLGLYIAKDLVCRQGGRIWVASELGRGSAFFFTLPLFSVTQWLLPTLSSKNLETRELALVTVELSGPSALSPAPAEKQLADVVRTVLERAVRYASDTVMPNLVPAAFERHLHVLAVADFAGAQGLSNRIRETLTSSAELAGIGGFEFKVSFQVRERPLEARSRSREEELQEIEAWVQQIVQGQTHEEVHA